MGTFPFLRLELTAKLVDGGGQFGCHTSVAKSGEIAKNFRRKHFVCISVKQYAGDGCQIHIFVQYPDVVFMTSGSVGCGGIS